MTMPNPNLDELERLKLQLYSHQWPADSVRPIDRVVLRLSAEQLFEILEPLFRRARRAAELEQELNQEREKVGLLMQPIP
jgi:hypothetical protein